MKEQKKISEKKPKQNGDKQSIHAEFKTLVVWMLSNLNENFIKEMEHKNEARKHKRTSQKSIN